MTRNRLVPCTLGAAALAAFAVGCGDTGDGDVVEPPPPPPPVTGQLIVAVLDGTMLWDWSDSPEIRRIDPRTGTTTVLGRGTGVRVSSDGSRLAYVAGQDSVMVMAPDGGERRLVGRGGSPAFSPDGGTLAWNTFDGRLLVRRLDDAEASPRELLRDPELASRWRSGRLDWSSDGDRLVYAVPGTCRDEPDPDQMWPEPCKRVEPVARLRFVSVAEGAVVRELAVGGLEIPFLRFAPDGRRLLTKWRSVGPTRVYPVDGDGHEFLGTRPVLGWASNDALLEERWDDRGFEIRSVGLDASRTVAPLARIEGRGSSAESVAVLP